MLAHCGSCPWFDVPLVHYSPQGRHGDLFHGELCEFSSYQYPHFNSPAASLTRALRRHRQLHRRSPFPCSLARRVPPLHPENVTQQTIPSGKPNFNFADRTTVARDRTFPTCMHFNGLDPSLKAAPLVRYSPRKWCNETINV